VPVCSLLWASDPFWKMTDVVVIRDEGAVNSLGILQLKQKLARLYYRGAVLLSLAEHAYKSQLVIGQVASSGTPLDARRSTHAGNPRMELMVQNAKCKQRIHVEQIFHGNSARSSRTWALVNWGTLGPALRTGRPVAGS